MHIIYSDLNLHFGDCTLLIRFLLDTTFHLVSRGSGIVRANGLATLGQKIKLKVVDQSVIPSRQIHISKS